MTSIGEMDYKIQDINKFSNLTITVLWPWEFDFAKINLIQISVWNKQEFETITKDTL